MKNQKIKSICISQVAVFDMHAANNGEKTLGNQSAVKKLPNGGAYVSGQMIKRAIMESYRKNFDLLPGEYLSEPDAKTNCDITNDVAADLRGFMDPDANRKRPSPIATQVAQPINKNSLNETILDLLTCFKRNQQNSMVQREISIKDELLFNFNIDVERVGVSDDVFSISQKDKTFERFYISHIPEDKRKQRVINALNALYYLNSFANQSRNAINGSPNKVIIVVDPIHSRKAFDFWKGSEKVRQSILDELKDRGAKYFIGDDEKKESKLSAYEAYKAATECLEECEISKIYSEVIPASKYWDEYSTALSEDKKKVSADKKEKEEKRVAPQKTSVKVVKKPAKAISKK